MTSKETHVFGHVASILGTHGPQAKQAPDKLALVWEHGHRTYGQLRDRSLRLATALREMGLSNGDRIATLFFNRGETFEIYFACAFAGITLVPISFRLTAGEISSILNDCDAKLVISEPELAGLLNNLDGSFVNRQIFLLDSEGSGADFERLIENASPMLDPTPTDIQLVLFTSGSTGKPKGVAIHGLSVLCSAFQQISQFRNLDDDTVMLINAPMFNTAGINECSIPTFLVGGTVAILPSRKWSAERFSGFVKRWRVTHTLVFPSMFRMILEADEEHSLPIDSIKWWYTGGENCPPPLLQQVQNRWPRIHLYLSYGSTESGFATCIEGADIETHPGSVGRVTAGHSLAIRDENGFDLPAGEIGEVWVSGPTVIRNYWNAPELDAETFCNGWLKMGDLGRMDSDGWIYIVGRSKDLVISKGQNIYPAEVENALRHHPSIVDVAVVGVVDEEFGEKVCACVVPRKGEALSRNEILDFIRDKLASYKKPRHIFFMESLPIRNATKVNKDELRRRCTQLLAEENKAS